MLSNLPEDLKSVVRMAFLEAAAKDKTTFAKLSDGKNQPFQPIDNAAYDDAIKLIQFVDRLRKKSS
jgi:phosphonate transport system substrate-binding protein